MNWLYRVNNWTIDEDLYPNVPLIPQRVLQFNNAIKDNIIVLPTVGKHYNTERI